MSLRNNLVPALGWAGIVAVLPIWRSDPIALLMVFRVLLVFGCLLIRFEPIRRAPRYQIIVSWLSMLLPMGLSASFPSTLVGNTGLVLAISGTAIAGWACLDLGRSFGISPAMRPFVASGIYRYVRHPMYLGHILTEIGLLMGAPTVRNFALVAISFAAYALRIRWEDDLISAKVLVPANEGQVQVHVGNYGT